MSTAVEMVGPYVLGDCLGRGGFATVYNAVHRDTKARVALKILHGTKQLEPEVQRRFVREIVVLKKLDHPNIVRVYEAGLHEGSIYCTMELVECGTLKEVLVSRYRLPWREAVEVAIQVCRALAHAHDRGCIHRDLKPANLYLSEDGLVKLGDLGLVRDLNDSRLTLAGQTVGTWRYMPPEQISGQDDIDGRVDLYSLGCIMFEMLSGHVPFDGADFITIFDQHLESAPPRLDVVVRDCPRELADIVDEMLAKQPEDRPSNAATIASRLQLLLAEGPGSTKTLRKSETNSDANLTQRLREGVPAQRGSWPWIAMLIVAAVLTALGLFIGLK